jgi:DNA-binding SARP family transcriptional activator
MLEIKLFGTGQAYYCGQTLAGFPNQQCYLLLCYLLLNLHYPHHRERLAAVFWGDYPTYTSRKHLSKALWRLRHALELAGMPADDYLCLNKECVSFVNSSRHWLDIKAFETAITRYQHLAGQALTLEQATKLEEAVDLYVGDLLEGIYEDWCLYDRERLGLLFMDTLCKLMTFHELNGTYEHGLAYGERLLERDITHERVHRQMMRLYWGAGDRGAALAQYKYCVQVLRDELCLAPMDETRNLYEQMTRNQFQPASHFEASPSAAIEPGHSFQQIAEQALQKLSRLQAITEESSAELRHLKRLIKAALSNSKQ